jgi:hypothetical protein
MKDLDFKNFILYGSYLKCSSSHGKTDLKNLLTNLAKKFTITEAFLSLRSRRIICLLVEPILPHILG